MNRCRAKMLRGVAQTAAREVSLPLDVRERALVSDLLYGAAKRFWGHLNSKERGAVSRKPGKLSTLLCIEVVNPETKKARSVGGVVGAMLEMLRPASYVTKGRPRRDMWRRNVWRTRRRAARGES
jgi:hypothetical protein